MLKISNTVSIPDRDISIQSIRAQGPGGQNVNKVSSAVHIRFDIQASELPDGYKAKLMALKDRRITRDGVIVIKAQTHRTREKNKIEGLQRLAALIRASIKEPRRRKVTQPTRASRKKRLESKARHSKIKALRRKINY
ncbi:MAG: class I peptide chain release factor [Desulfobacterales bacterium]|nr:MAG: class I peptide chain release factor [Desulfobacterales bacterium]